MSEDLIPVGEYEGFCTRIEPGVDAYDGREFLTTFWTVEGAGNAVMKIWLHSEKAKRYSYAVLKHLGWNGSMTEPEITESSQGLICEHWTSPDGDVTKESWNLAHFTAKLTKEKVKKIEDGWEKFNKGKDESEEDDSAESVPF